MRSILSILLLSIATFCSAQSNYQDSLKQYIGEYVSKHPVVKGDDRQKLAFFPIDPSYRVTAKFEPAKDSKWFNLPTSGSVSKTYRAYGYLRFTIRDTVVMMPVYQAQSLLQNEEYKDYLFLPFTDLSSGEDTYAVGRYIDLKTTDIVNNNVVIDFNKAYNPYCAYVSGVYNCPIPPKENQLNVRIAAGEKAFVK